MTQPSDGPRRYVVHLHEAAGSVAEQFMPGYTPGEPKQFSVDADAAHDLAVGTLDASDGTPGITAELRAPAEDYLRDQIRLAATEAHEDVYHFTYNSIRDHERVQSVIAYRGANPDPGTPANNPAHRLAVQALASAESTRALPEQIRPQMEAYIREAVESAATRSRQVVLAAQQGKASWQVPGLADFKDRVDAARAQQVLGANTPAHRATGPAQPGASQGERTTPSIASAKNTGTYRGQ